MADEEPQIEFTDRGLLIGHTGWVTGIVAGYSQKDQEETRMLVSCSRDKTIIVWRLNLEAKDGDDVFGQPQKLLTGHDHFIQDICLSSQNQFALSASWDGTMRLWDLQKGKVEKKFIGHTKEVLSCCFNPNNRVILSGGCEKNIKLWNVKAECKYTIEANNHQDWVSKVRYSPSKSFEYFATCGWDGYLKIWNKNFQIKYTFRAHKEAITALAIAPIGKYIATGGKDCTVKVWDIENLQEAQLDFNAKSQVNDLKFNSQHQWLAAATDNGISIWDLQNGDTKPFTQLTHVTTKKLTMGKNEKTHLEKCTAIEWNANGTRLFGGFADGAIRVWDVSTSEAMD